MSTWREAYYKNTPTSKKIFTRSQQLHINGVSHNIRYYEPYPFVTDHSTGKYLVDVDSNRYTDYWMGHWSLILGHGSNKILKKIKEQLSHGWMYGTVNKQTMELSNLISKAMPVAERIRYVTSGTEAVMYAARLSRAFTNKPIIAKIDGGWHGYASDLLKTINWPFTEPESSGVTSDEHVVSIPYNNIEDSIKILNSVKEQLAGIMVEPILGGSGGIPAEDDYLKSLQEFAAKSGSLFMLDEIVTGFRLGYGGMYKKIGLSPDIVTLGKVVGGGMPIGVICGKKEVMEIANTSKMSRRRRCYIGGGTFSANPVSMAAGAATLNTLKNNATIYEKINSLGKQIRHGINKILNDKSQITGRGSLFMTHFPKSATIPIRDAATASECDQDMLYNYHMYLIAREGIFFLPGKLGAVSDAHDKLDVKDIIQATERFAADELKR
ncbi:MAG: aminotransferase class III-fold pyridoxal phosphate-dependent enzyme [Cenarchaeum sp. SB0661_bin_35]|nr:aminotransferase class III-fold pyridoxal phosphate-dependent enzyme [Cenarchaeum sp. SB0666_bin_15]MYB46491.1 aminotransferase class III-fold pyridoxal phosphate-dependent enzyme [Cenarchaeum sp. SB0662_bin_33]MYC79705.1 aminotransferase class III-fold pyridoxal phosphate-dependent enzyme [Cenarchaeum sp. SB0661_bin_35]MYD58900.1 aminotransferase class III-fold pyridoxal phosphate-dependent enzyme [Cenarchaeum sp. SB0678_bin_8]MYI51618.1 aminotransferase class III-fold pyridoxal phosphate-d